MFKTVQMTSFRCRNFLTLHGNKILDQMYIFMCAERFYLFVFFFYNFFRITHLRVASTIQALFKVLYIIIYNIEKNEITIKAQKN